MIIDLFEVSGTALPLDFEIAPEDVNLQEDSARLRKLVNFKGSLQKGIAQTDVEGRVIGEIEIDCTRCLAPVHTPFDFPFTATYVTGENYTQDAEAQLRAADLDVAVFDGEKIDLTDLAREQILLNLPARFLCKEDCRGLCAKCGANKNMIDCSCEDTEIDPRWEKLGELKIKN